MTKKLLSIVLCIVIALCTMPVVLAEDANASLTSVYGDGMLFAQNKEAILSGTASADTVIKAELFDSENTLVTSAEAVTDENGKFEVSFTAPAGSYEEYTIVLTADGVEFEKLENIVFGELWLASGQSNMQYPLSQTPGGLEMKNQNKKLSKWLRVLLVPATPEYNGSTALLPADPQENIKNLRWVNGEDSAVYETSGVAYYFAENLMKELDMPVGILNCSLGGSTIISWISREAIDNDVEVKELLQSKNYYYDKETWDESVRNIYYDMSGNFNMKVNAIRHFRPTGMIWYQGESDLMYKYKPEQYASMFDLLQKSYSEVFGFENKLMPIVYTQLASYLYSDKGFELPAWNSNYVDMQREYSDSRAVITITDVSLTYTPKGGFIHPETKEPVGKRMAYAAQGLVYGADYDYSAPYMDSYEIIGTDVYLKFKNVGDGLIVNGEEVNGFAICGANGIYIPADAEIISKDTVKVSASAILKPISVTYAYAPKNNRSNLYASNGENLTMPVSCFITKEVSKPHYWVDKPWADCEEPEEFQNYYAYLAKMYPNWVGKDCDLDYNTKSAFKGTNGLNITSDSNKFAINNIMSDLDDSETKNILEIDADYSDYKTMSFYIKNNGDTPITLSAVRFYSEAVLWYDAEIVSTDSTETVIPADNEWHLVTADLNSLYLMGSKSGFIYTNNLLDEVKAIKLVFTADGNSDISVDEFNFSAEGVDSDLKLNKNYSFLRSTMDFIKAIFPAFIEWLLPVIKNLV
ncbi:MAG: hypothetical protein IJM97_08480 [Clostridia bacterium]|nr:hypothetical protein [Clostridia bacterium]